MNISPQLRRRLKWCLVWLRDMTVFVVAFWLLSWGCWTLMNLMVDAAIASVDAAERQAYDLQGRKAWDAYCQDVVDQVRPDDLNAFDPANGECSQMVWEPADEAAEAAP